jgi:hypothetical protein
MTLRRLLLVISLMAAGILCALAGRYIDEPVEPQTAVRSALQRPAMPDAVVAPSTRM